MRTTLEIPPPPMRKHCYEVPLRNGYFMAQVIVPLDLTKEEAERLCQFVRSMIPEPPKGTP